MVRNVSEREMKLCKIVEPYIVGVKELRSDVPEEAKQAHRELLEIGKREMYDPYI